MAQELNVCSVCGITGKNGANWALYVDGMSARTVHKFCGEQAIAGAPKGVNAKLVSSREVRDRRRIESNVQSFWAERFAQAKPIHPERPTKPVLLAAE